MSVWYSFNWIQGSKSLCTNEGLKEYLRGQVKCCLNISYGGYGVMVDMYNIIYYPEHLMLGINGPWKCVLWHILSCSIYLYFEVCCVYYMFETTGWNRVQRFVSSPFTVLVSKKKTTSLHSCVIIAVIKVGRWGGNDHRNVIRMEGWRNQEHQGSVYSR